MGLSNPATSDSNTAASSAQPFDEAAAYAQQQREEAALANAGQQLGAAAVPDQSSNAAGPDLAGASKTSQPAAEPQHQQQAQPQTQHQPPPQPVGQRSFTQPVTGVPIRGPTAQPAPQHVIIGYQLIRADEACSCDLRLEGWLSVFILIIIFPPIAWIPCFIPDCFQTYQVPIYGPPGSVPPGVSVGIPVGVAYRY
jgi:hypothetical protein